MLMKLTTAPHFPEVTYLRAGVNFINVMGTNFSYECRFFYLQVTRENNVHTKNSYV